MIALKRSKCLYHYMDADLGPAIQLFEATSPLLDDS